MEHAGPEWLQAPASASLVVAGLCATLIVVDIAAGRRQRKWFTFFVPVTLFGMSIFAAWAIDYVPAFAFGIAFQYFTIVPMRGLSPAQGAGRLRDRLPGNLVVAQARRQGADVGSDARRAI